MHFKVTCVACGNQKKIARARAGQAYPCEICGGVMPVPSYHGKKDPFVRLNSNPPSLFQRLAAIFGFLNGLTCIVGAGIILFSGAAQTTDTARPEMNYLSGGLLVALAATFAFLGLIYFFAGINIRENGVISAIVVLVFGPAQALFLGSHMIVLVGMQKLGGPSMAALKNAFNYEAATVSLLVVYCLCTIFSLATQDGLLRERASRYFTLLCVYGYLTFAALVTFQGFLIMGHPLAGVQMPAQLQDKLALVSGIWLAVATLLWLVSACVARNQILGTIVGFLIALPLTTECGWYLVKNVPGALARHDMVACLPLALVGFFALLALCATGLLVRSALSPRPAPEGAEKDGPIERLAFDL